MIIDRDVSTAAYLSAYLSKHQFEVSMVSSGEEALSMFRVYDPHLILLDPAISGTNGTGILERIKQIKPKVSVILLFSAQSDPEPIFRAFKLGADDYIARPFEPKELQLRIAKLLDKRRQVSEAGPEPGHRNGDFAMLFGNSRRMEEIRMTIEQVADTTATVLIRGESGTGKEVVARAIYGHSSRRDKPFVKVNCAAIPYELLESELFGYERGAFTGANRQKPGKFDQAHGGTIFLDEISEMHPALQAKLLHVLQDGEFARLGGKRDIAVDARVLAATNMPLEKAVEAGQFRRDLYYRLNVVAIHLPPLRERREEIPVFLDFFLRKYKEYYGKQPPPFSEYALSRMMEYSWPGNIRELENLVKRHVIIANEAQIICELSSQQPRVEAVPTSKAVESKSVENAVGSPPVVLSTSHNGNGHKTPSLIEIAKRATMQAEREAIERVLIETRWNRVQAAKILGISYKALLKRLKVMQMQKQNQSWSRQPPSRPDIIDPL